MNGSVFRKVESIDQVYYIEEGKSFGEDRKHFSAYVVVAYKDAKDQAATDWHTERD